MGRQGERDALLRSKLAIPRQAAERVPRPALLERLQEGLSGSLTLICAPAGFGKTTLACEWIAACGRNAAWVSLDAGDNAGGRMWRCVVEAVDRVRPGYLKEASPALPLLSASDLEQAMPLLLNGLARSDEELLIVLDDYHFIDEPKLLEATAYFAEYLPGGVHLCLLSRTEPGFPMSRLEARRMAHRLEADDLRFTEREGESYFASVRVALDAPTVADVVRRTEGWVTGLQLAAWSWRKGGERTLREFSGGNRQVSQYMLEEVWSQLPERLRAFLLRCSVLNRWNASLCRAVTGFEDSEALIADIDRSHLFVVSLDADGRWFRFHHLFAGFLRRLAEREGAESAASLYLRAGRWFAEASLEEEAVEAYLAGGHDEEAIGLLERMATRVVQWDWPLVERFLSLIPVDSLLEHPVLFFSYVNSMVAENAGKTAQAEALLAQADRRFAELRLRLDEGGRDEFLALSHYVKGMLAVFARYDLQGAKPHFEQALRLAPGGIRMIFGLPQTPLQAITLKTYKIVPGQMTRVIVEPYTMKLAELLTSVNPVYLGRLYVNHAETLYYWNDLEQAKRFAAEGLSWSEQKPIAAEYELVPGWIVQAKLLAAKGSWLEAAAALEDGIQRLRAQGVGRGVDLLEAEQIRLQLRRGHAAPLLEWAERCRYRANDRISVYELHDYELYARALLLGGRRDEAAALLDRLLFLAEREMRLLDVVEIRFLQAQALWLSGEKRRALGRLDEGMRFAELQQYVRLPIDEGPALLELVAELAEAKRSGRFGGEGASSPEFVRAALAEMERGAAAGQKAPLAVAGLLTPRELDVLQALLDDASGKRIAAKLHITYETLKTHRKNIYEKLGVRTREEAIRRWEHLSERSPFASP